MENTESRVGKGKSKAKSRAKSSVNVPATVEGALDRVLGHLSTIQRQDGCWEGEVVWNPMLLSQYIFVQRICGREISAAQRKKMIQYFRVTATPLVDGMTGWGMHPESGPYVFFTALSYVALRLLGVPTEDPLCAAARAWLHRQPNGLLSIPSWGKFWLSVLRLYKYEGMNPIPPELFVLPEQLPLHPNNYYCHTRYIYLGIAYLYGRKFSFDLGAVGEQLRAELYDLPFDDIDFAAHRHDLAETDLYVRPTPLLRTAYDALYQYEKRHSVRLRRYALRHCFERVLYEQRVSRYQGISPVNGLLNCLAIFSVDPHHPDLAASLDGVESWKWEDDEAGIRYAGAHSNAWDTAFVLRGALEAPSAERDRFAESVRRGYAYLRDTQMQEELPGFERERRDPILGGWCFSDGQHRWAVSDCTAEALSAIVAIHQTDSVLPVSEPRISDERILQAVQFILRRQNDDGGFGTYERRRGGGLLESLNPSEMYGNCMTERSYIECTSSCVGALGRLRTAYPSLFPSEGHAAIERGVAFLRAAQRPDGSWAAFWGINFTYAIFHVTEGLLGAGVKKTDPALERAAEWLLGKQRADGGWGEHYSSCLTDQYVEHKDSQVIMTSWALLALSELVGCNALAVQRGVDWLRKMQLPDGSFPQQALGGVFFGTAMLDYKLYKEYFPMWALARAAR